MIPVPCKLDTIVLHCTVGFNLTQTIDKYQKIICGKNHLVKVKNS